MYTVILYAHILSAALSIGPFFVLVLLVKRIREADTQYLSGLIATFRSAIRLVMHAGHVLVATGVLLIWQGPWSWHSPWILMTLAVMFSSVFFLARAFSPVLKKFAEPEADHPALAETLQRSLWIYILLLLLMLWFMVDKPTLWQ
ncbi:hypothetical protein [Planococcus halotolerans]|uniref:DUF2269 domain-containing protein n=1 Tax=Planococcus halotolerans TaxID=2233542 RepID=A0A365KRL6_9BACL|nr:hypothetical protein [Planococcus halotolerans]QHJ69502.1 hypothetical protein DNR44_002140 [Planococcus halotolerans]RAZ75452.1 hypothetical protein DP120_13850 [Planococcus halotolerans]